jgi:hypothetical protein
MGLHGQLQGQLYLFVTLTTLVTAVLQDKELYNGTDADRDLNPLSLLALGLRTL